MLPVVIDAKKKRQYAGLFIVSIVASFVLGFGSGFFINQRLESQSFDQLKSEIMKDSQTASEEKPTGDVSGDKAEENTDEKTDGTTDGKEAAAEKKTVNRDVQVKKSEKKAPEKIADRAQKPPAEKKSPPVKPEPPPSGKKVALVTAESRPEPKPKPRPSPEPELKPAPEPKPEPKPEPAPSAESSPQPAPNPVRPPAEVNTDSGDNLAVNSSRGQPLAPMRPPGSEADTDTEKTVEKNTKMFAVQVGLFANRDNAQTLVYELVDKGYDAYMEAFVASDGEEKYNVRFGRYPDRASVQRRLADYKQHYATSAYIIITQ